MIKLEIREVHLPFWIRYGHARKQHRHLEAVVCVATDVHGNRGLGEAVPRAYVTGETCASILADIPRVVASLESGVRDVAALREQRRRMCLEWPDAFPSCALCAIDTALLDLYAGQAGCPLAQWLGADSLAPLVYSASIGLGKLSKLVATLLLYRSLGLRHFKVKVSGDEDIGRIRLIRKILGSEATLFADANAHWDRETAVRHIETLATLGVWAVEEPLRVPEPPAVDHGQLARHLMLTEQHYADCRWLRARVPLPLIADESLISLSTAERIVAHEAFDILNIRLAKCGGPLAAGAMVDLARRHNLQFACGAMVGETPILASAGSHFAAAYRDHLYVQGHSHRLLHGVRFVRGEPRIGRGGRLQLGKSPGLGLEVDFKKLDTLTVRRAHVSL